jgi:hypothetical protein
MAATHATQTKRISAQSSVTPPTEARWQHTSDFEIIPGSVGYQKLADRLRNGDVSYGEFINRTTPSAPELSPINRLIRNIRILLAGLVGVR